MNMMTDGDCYRALSARDSRFDGSFFVCVSTTRIYCRPVCPARTPRRERCRFVPTAAAAEAAGFRPCLRCRPETAPGSAGWLGHAALVQRALRMISETAPHGVALESLAPRLGVSSRHLRRIFNEHVGATPKAVAQTERFALARQLLIETDLPIAEIAMAAGFGSIRRFNDATRNAFGMTPTELRSRNRHVGPTAAATFRLRLGYRPPYAWQAMLDYFRMRSVSGLERVDGNSYHRSVSVGGIAGLLSVTDEPARNRLIAQFRLERPAMLSAAAQRVRDMFDLEAVPCSIADVLGRDRLLGAAVARTPGLRIPGCWSPFEMLVRAIVGQQVSVKSATTVLGRLVAKFGRSLLLPSSPNELPDKLFPEPAVLATQDLGQIGLTKTRAATLAAVAARFVEQPEFITPTMAPGEARRRLLEIRGIGPWTAEYVGLRALRNPDAFPAADLGLIKAAGARRPSELATRAEAWRPWRGYAVVYLWTLLP